MGIGGAMMRPAILGMTYCLLPRSKAGLAGGVFSALRDSAMPSARYLAASSPTPSDGAGSSSSTCRLQPPPS